MSKSIHITKKNFKDLTKKELDEQAEEPNSELRHWARKSELKKEVKKKRKNGKKS
jgi:TfoX/Sxy family transcriptional regulator of competence genes